VTQAAPAAAGGIAPAQATDGSVMGEVASVRQIGRGTAWYAASVVIARAVSIVMLPIYTRYLTPGDYGQIQMLGVVSDMTAIFLTAGMTSGVQRFYFKARTEPERNAVLSTALLFELLLALVGTTILVAFAGPLARQFLGGAQNAWLVRLTGIDFSATVLWSVPMMLLQSRGNVRAVTAVSLARLAAQLTLNVYLIVGEGWGAAAMITSSLVVNLVQGIGLATWMLRTTGVQWSAPVVRALRAFGVPHQLSFAGAFVSTYGDRFFIQALAGLPAVGIYSLAYQFGFLLVQVSAVPFLQAWNPMRHATAGRPKAERDALAARVFFFFNLLLLTAALGLCVGIDPALTVLTAPAFRTATALVPPIVLAYVIQSWTDVVRFGIDVAERTVFHAYATLACALVTLACYVLLIPRFAGHGAAWATCIGFAVRFVLSYRWANQLWPTDYGWRRAWQMLGLSFGCFGLYAFARPDALWMQIVAGASVLVLFLVLVSVFVASPPERATLRSALGHPARALALLVGK